MGRGQLRLDSITGSYGTGVEDINDQTGLVATGSANLSDIAGVFSHLASSIKRIHGHDSFSEAQPGVFKQNLQVTGTLGVTAGISGSLTQLTDGTSYLIAGSNVTIATGSNGAVTISSTAAGGAGDSYFTSTTNGSVFTTGSVAIRGSESAVDSPTDKGTDIFFYVSGSTAGNTSVSLFGGDLVTSGALFLQNRATAPTADSSEGVIYSRAGKLYYKEASGVETPFNTGSAVSSTFWNTKVPPTNPNSKDDEFDDGVLAAKWSEFDPPGILTVTENNYGLLLSTADDPGSSASIVGIHQPVPADDEFEMVSNISINGNTGNFSVAGLFIAGDIVTNPTTAPIVTLVFRISTGGNDTIEGLDYASRTTLPPTQLAAIDMKMQIGYLAMQWKESTGKVCFWYSQSGVEWTRLGAAEYTPPSLSSADYFGILINGVDQACRGTSEFFRVRSAASGLFSTAPLSQGARVNVSTGILSGSGTDNRIVRWNGSQGVQDSGITVDDSANLSTSGNLSGSFVVATTGFSGSLTRLTDGTSYLIAGNNVTITTGSNGAVTIASTATGGGGDSFFSSTTNGSVFTTGSVAFRGTESAIDSPADKGTDVFFYVSGSITDGLNRSLFGGHLVSSGSVKALGGVSGSLTKLTDGTSYIIAGTGATVTTGSSGAVTVGVSPSYITSISWLVG